ncbi:hypothetical protein AB0M32_05265 [Streptomyces sp. NPDC051985]|uniref:hypothetical protein n=1 Tax=Streptomyces sp. NPDC051985 TaxID=3155807 RepID=UPI00342BD309
MTSPPPPPDPFASLGLDAARVRTAADFHESYARFVQNTEQGRDDFAALVEAASAYRLAGQWRLLVAPKRGVELLLESASVLDRADLMYGHYLRASLAPDTARDRLSSWTDQLLRTDGRPHDEPGPPAREPDEILGHVQQQAYLLLACAALTTPGSSQATELRSFADRSPHRDGVVPMGSMAMPVRTFWNLALNMLSPETESAARSYAGTLTELSRAYARTVDLARANTRTWSNAAAPIDVTDLDLIGTVAMGVRRFDQHRMRGLLLRDGVELPAVARVQLNLGMEVARPDGPGWPPDLDGPERPDGPSNPPGVPPNPSDPRGQGNPDGPADTDASVSTTDPADGRGVQRRRGVQHGLGDPKRGRRGGGNGGFGSL